MINGNQIELENKKGGRKPSRRAARYGKLVRGWDWRTTPELLSQADELTNQLGITRTELIERSIAELIARNTTTQ